MSQYYFYKGRVALYALLKAFDIGVGSRILIPGYTCVVVPSAIRFAGAIPEYTDVDSNSYNSLLCYYEQAYSRLQKRGVANDLRAIIIQHTYGNPNRDSLEIVKWARNKKLKVIEDCCHINGSFIGTQAVGDLGDASFFSTQWSKPFTTGLGGIAQLNDEFYAKKMDQLEKKAIFPQIRENAVLTLQLVAHTFLLRPSLYWFAINTHRTLSKMGIFVGSSTVGELAGQMPEDYFKKMGIVQKSLLKQRAGNVGKVNSYRQWLANEYDILLQRKSIPIYAREDTSYLLRYPIRVRDKMKCLKYAEEQKIELGEWFDHPLHPAGCCLDELNWDPQICPNAVSAASEVINMPVHNKVTIEHANRIVNYVSKWAKNIRSW